MNALTLLEDDHKDIKKLLDKTDDTTERAVKTRAALLHEIGVKLTAHEKIEEDIFYPALKKHPKAKDIVLEGYQDVVRSTKSEVRSQKYEKYKSNQACRQRNAIRP